MFEKRDMQRLETIFEKIVYIDEVVQNYKNIVSALEDEKMAKPAILMHFIGIAEQFSKLKDEKLIQNFSEDIKGAMSIRNFIAHDYDGVNLVIIEKTIKEILPDLKNRIEKILKGEK